MIMIFIKWKNEEDKASVLISVFSSRFNRVQHAIKKTPQDPCLRSQDVLLDKALDMITFLPTCCCDTPGY